MSADAYADARTEVAELMHIYSGINESHQRLYAHLVRKEHEFDTIEIAVATRLVALLTMGIEVPSSTHFPCVLAPDGRRIRVSIALPERDGLFDGGMGMALHLYNWEEWALVAFERGMPRVVHIIDRERMPLIVEMMKGESLEANWPISRIDVMLGPIFSYNVMLEPTMAVALGIRTFVLDESESVGWRRVVVT